MELTRIFLYRMTHIDNVPHILQYGITHRHSASANPNYRPIGDVALIDTRNTKTVHIDNGVIYDDIEHLPTITLGDYTPFYLGIRMPMLYVIQKGGNFVKEATPPDEIIYMAYPLASLIDSGVAFYFTDGHATDHFTSFYDATHVHLLGQIVDWQAIRSRHWGGKENLDLKRKKQAEVLVKGDLPAQAIHGYVCYSEQAKQQLMQLGIRNDSILVRPKAYF